MTRLLFLILALSLTLLPASAQTELEASAEALRQAQYREALELCQKIEANGQASFGSLYNQGLALLHLGDRARARASFERALLLEPRSLATRRQLREVECRFG